MKLYKVTYKTWNTSFSKLLDREKLSVGKDEEEAIQKVKSVVDNDARDFEAKEITEVFGHKICVE